jgi:hypothetical protein
MTAEERQEMVKRFKKEWQRRHGNKE